MYRTRVMLLLKSAPIQCASCICAPLLFTITRNEHLQLVLLVLLVLLVQPKLMLLHHSHKLRGERCNEPQWSSLTASTAPRSEWSATAAGRAAGAPCPSPRTARACARECTPRAAAARCGTCQRFPPVRSAPAGDCEGKRLRCTRWAASHHLLVRDRMRGKQVGRHVHVNLHRTTP